MVTESPLRCRLDIVMIRTEDKTNRI
eukprot:COSAG01_NODE_59404_length_300_cov_1.029851_1_plen_25_part_01